MIGISDIINDFINDQTPCTIVFQVGSEIFTFADCIIRRQDGIMIEFFYPSNGITYTQLMSDFLQIRRS